MLNINPKIECRDAAPREKRARPDPEAPHRHAVDLDLLAGRQRRTALGQQVGEAEGPAQRWIDGEYEHSCRAREPLRLVGEAMVSAIAAAVALVWSGNRPRWAGWLSLALCAPPVVLAQTRIFPHAVRLGARSDDAAEQSRLACSICASHLVCLAAMAALTALQLWLGAAG